MLYSYFVKQNRKEAKIKPRIFLIIIAFFVTFFSCGKENNGPTGPENTTPLLSSIENQTVTAGQTKDIALSATDADGDPLTFSIPTNPGFLSITGLSQVGDTATATLVIAPDETITGTFDATVQVSDGEGGEDSDNITIEVTEPDVNDVFNGLIAYYPFNGNANDESSNEYNGVVNGATLTTDRFGNDSSAYSFDGSTSWIDIGTEFPSPDTAIAISAWIYLDSYPNDPDFYQNCFSVVNRRHSFILQIFGETGVALVLHNGNAFTGFWQNEPITSIFSLYTWYHIVVSYSVLTAQKRIYIDGQSVYLEDRPEGSPSIITPTNEALKIGTQNDEMFQWFNGKIDDVRIYNRTLSEVEIQALYNE
jgi:hypothetical protein